jgi:large subunit ribosomal protein L5
VEKSDAPRGMNITFVTSTTKDKEAYELLHVLGLPFAKEKQN